MNIFFLDYDPHKAAAYYVDRHVVKIITEINQCLASAYPNGVAPYKWAYHNHPMTVWCRTSKANFNWARQHCRSLCMEYTYRYGKTHKGQGIVRWYACNPPNLPDIGITPPPRCFGEFKDLIPVTGDVVEDYRNYYRLGKSHLFKWKNRSMPEWLKVS